MSQRAAILTLVICVAAFVGLALGDILSTSPTYDEPFQLVAGYTQLSTGDHRFGPDHPPLFRRVAALPLLWMQTWPAAGRPDATRAIDVMAAAWTRMPFDANAHYAFEKQFLFGLADPEFGSPTTEAVPLGAFLNDAQTMIVRARVMILLTTGVLLAILVFCWSFELWGASGAAWSVLLFCFDPSFIAHSGLVTTDAAAATLMFAAVYFFWRSTRSRPIANGALFAASFAAAMLAKYSCVLLVPILLLLVPGKAGLKRRLAILAAAGVFAFVAIWGVYGFRFRASSVDMRVEAPVTWWYGAAELLERYSGAPPIGAPMSPHPPIGLAGRLVLAAQELRLLPQPYLYGFAEVRAHSLARGSFLRGQFATLGFHSYFLWTFLYKTPLLTMLAIAAGVAIVIRRRSPATAFLLVPVALYFAVSVTSSLNIGHRHLLPIYPFLYVAAGSIATVASRRAILAVAPLAVLPAFVVLAPWQPVVNQHLAYFNELGGGPERGGDLLVDSNLDWGQDLPRLAAWLQGHGVSEPINLVYFGTADPRAYGIRYVNVERGYTLERPVPLRSLPRPALLAISITALRSPSAADHEFWPNALRGAKLVGRAGYSILIYRLE